MLELRDVVLSDGPDLQLRKPNESDIDDIVAMCQDPIWQGHVNTPIPYRQKEAEEYLERINGDWSTGQAVGFAIVHNGRFAGNIGLRIVGDRATVGYGLAPWARRQGLATRAMRLVLQFAFAQLGITSVRWACRVGNWASRGVAERCGFNIEPVVELDAITHRGCKYDAWVGSKESLAGCSAAWKRT